MDEKKWRKTAGRLLAGFLLLTVAGTVASRVADSWLVAKVQTAAPAGKCLTFRYTGSGELEPEKEEGIWPVPGLIVEELLAEAGTEVEKGTQLFRYRLESIEDALKALNQENREIRIACQELKLSEGEELKAARKSLERADRAVQEAEEELEQLQEECEKERQESRESAVRQAEEKLEAAEEALEDARTAAGEREEELLWQREEAEEALAELQAEWNDIQNKIDRYAELLNTTGAVLPAELNKEKKSLREELSVLQYGGSETYQQHLDEVTNQALNGNQLGLAQATRKDTVLDQALRAYAKAEAAQTEAEKAGQPQTAQAEAELSEVEAAREEAGREVWVALFTKEGLAAREEALEAAEEELRKLLRTEDKEKRTLTTAVEKAERAYEKATEELEKAYEEGSDYEKELAGGRKALEEARREQEAAVQELQEAGEKAGRQAQLLNLKLEGLEEQLEEQEQEQAQLEKLMEAGGVYASECNGTILQCSLEAGTSYTGGQAAYRLGTGSVQYRAELDREAEGWIKTGDVISLSFTGQTAPAAGRIKELSRRDTPDGEVLELTAVLTGKDGKETTGVSAGYKAGRRAEYTLEKQTDYYECCIPLSALREDSGGKYVLVLRERDRILGREQYTVRIPVTLLAVDGTSAAVNGALSGQDEVITSSSRSLTGGERVRRWE